jgi:prepilin-type N-terminal cleavage/methylation domain-containing protein
MMHYKLKSKNAMPTGRQGYSLVEVLAAIVIVSTVMIVATSSIFSSAKISINNEISDRANTLAVRILELAKKVDQTLPACGGTEVIELEAGLNFSVANVDLTNTNQAENICIQEIVDNRLIEDCADNSQYKTEVILPGGEETRGKEVYCIQVKIEIQADSAFKKITVRLVYDDLSNEDLVKSYYGLI